MLSGTYTNYINIKQPIRIKYHSNINKEKISPSTIYYLKIIKFKLFYFIFFINNLLPVFYSILGKNPKKAINPLNKLYTKRVLLIGNSYKELPGTENDINTISKILKSYDFDMDNKTLVYKLYEKTVIQENILKY